MTVWDWRLGPPNGYRKALGVPSARRLDFPFRECPRCGQVMNETLYAAHYVAVHAEADGHIFVNGIRYEPV